MISEDKQAIDADRHRKNLAPVVAIAGLAAAAGFAAIARAVAQRATAAIDHEVHDETALDESHPARRAAEKVAPLGKWWAYVPIAIAAGSWVAWRGRAADRRGTNAVAGALAIIATAASAAGINEAFEHLLPQPPAPPGRPSPNHPVFPSGHAFGTTAVGLAIAFVAWREEACHPAIAFPLAALVPSLSGGARLVEEKHWISDIVGGACAAIALAAIPLAAYEATC